MAKVAVSADFLAAYAQVPRKVQKKVREFARKFLENPTQASINYERIRDIKDPKVRTVRIGIDYRAIVIHPPKGDVYTLVWVDHHDEAMAWARKKRFDVNPVLGSFQMYEVEEATEVETRAPTESDAIGEGLVFAGRTRGDLRCGVPELLLPAVCAVATEQELDRLVLHLPIDVGDTLLMVAAGYPVDQALAEVAQMGGKSIDVDDVAAALERPGSRRHFRVVANEEEFDGLLEGPMDMTMTYSEAAGRALFEDEDAGTWPLAIEVDGEELERRIEPGETVVFGRHDSCQVVLRDPHVSRRQLRVTNLGSRMEIEKLPSKNRAVVVGRRAQDGVYYCSPEIWVRVADTHIKLRRAGAPDERVRR